MKKAIAILLMVFSLGFLKAQNDSITIKGKIQERKNSKKIDIDNHVLVEINCKGTTIAKNIVNLDGKFEFKISKSCLNDSIIEIHVTQQPLFNTLKIKDRCSIYFDNYLDFKLDEQVVYQYDLWVDKPLCCPQAPAIYFNNNIVSYYIDSFQNPDSTFKKMKDLLFKYPQYKLSLKLYTNIDELKGKKLAFSRIEKVKKEFILNGIQANRIIVKQNKAIIMECSKRITRDCLSTIIFGLF